MKRFEISKGNGKVRVIYAPNRREKRRLQKLVPFLAELERDEAAKANVSNVAHGFITGRNAVTCATQHVGFRTTITCDMAGWFDSVSKQHLQEAGVPDGVINQITIDGALRQGLPTSPSGANLCAVLLDEFIMSDMRRISDGGLGFAYTRYADDITISIDTSEECIINGVLYYIAKNVHAMGWQLADHKTHVYHAHAGRRPVVGVSVGPADVRPTRKTQRKVRAAFHTHRRVRRGAGIDDFDAKQKQKQSGIQEWAECRLPRSARPRRQIVGLMTCGAPATQVTPVDQQNQTVQCGAGRRIVVTNGEEEARQATG